MLNLPYRNIHGLFHSFLSQKPHEYYGKAFEYRKFYEDLRLLRFFCSPLPSVNNAKKD